MSGVWIEHADARTYKFPWKANLIICDPSQKVGRYAAQDLIKDGTFDHFNKNWLVNTLKYLDMDGVICLFCLPEFQYEYEKILRTFASISYRETIIWSYNFGRYTRKRFVNSHQCILIYESGKPKFNWKACAIESQRLASGDRRADARGRTPSSVWFDIPRMPGNQKQRYSKLPQLPIKLVKRLIKAFNAKHVIDPMCGSGTVPTLCKYLKIPCVGTEIDEHIYTIAKERLEECDVDRLI